MDSGAGSVMSGLANAQAIVRLQVAIPALYLCLTALRGTCCSNRLDRSAAIEGLAVHSKLSTEKYAWAGHYNCAMDKVAEQDPRVYFAVERTFLAWIRTGLGLIGIGFAVSRFGLFLRQLSQSESHAPTRATGLSVWSGVTLVGLGVAVILSSVLRHFQTIKELKSGTWTPGVSRDAVLLGFILAAAGIGMCIYLIVLQ
jgi:putative membrane protein